MKGATMFAATLLFCLHVAAATPRCGMLVDRLGPFATEAACQKRLAQMDRALKAALGARGFPVSQPGAATTQPVCRKQNDGIGI
ncbi:MAG: hypothetical protein AAGF59_15045 [Pseudomonadota bacterium]